MKGEGLSFSVWVPSLSRIRRASVREMFSSAKSSPFLPTIFLLGFLNMGCSMLLSLSVMGWPSSSFSLRVSGLCFFSGFLSPSFSQASLNWREEEEGWKER